MNKAILLSVLFLVFASAAFAETDRYIIGSITPTEYCYDCPVKVSGFKLGPAYEHSTIDKSELPVATVYDPENNRNEDITRLSFEELAGMMGTAKFNRWNDVGRVCETMDILYGRVAPACYSYVPPHITSGTARAYVSFTILPQPTVITPATPRYVDTPNGPSYVVVVDPVYPPWSPTYNPYW